jgi:hypothetical protein
MSRIGIAVTLIFFVGFAQAQAPGMAPPLPIGASTDADVRDKKVDPAAVEIPLYAGARVMDVLQSLTDKGFAIKWDKSQIGPSMKLLEKPKATRIDSLLSEILTPWGFRADHNLRDGGYRVRPLKNPKKKSVEPPPGPVAVPAIVSFQIPH